MKEESEILFSNEELKVIEDYVIKNPYLRDPMLMNITRCPSDIVNVSPIRGLIFAKGNEHTGFNHIHHRHEQWTSLPKWIESKDKHGNINMRLQNQGLFREDSVPFFDYCNIAESLYKKENINTEKNKKPELFEMYTGEHIHKDKSISKYNLLVYKNTKIVHTLYPQSNKNNPKRVKGFSYSRGVVSGSLYFMNSIEKIEIPYLNHQETIKYVLIIRRILHKGIEMAIVQVNDNAGNPWKSIVLGERNIKSKSHNESFETVLMRYQYADLRGLEKMILEIDKSKK
jgi:hypothetical protein